MGVTGLWKLIEPCGKPVPVETLEGKVLAVDISIWLHQVVKGFQDNKGAALNNAHLLGLFNRLCKLMYYRVKPVFVFDGCVPQLKKETIARRQQQRSKLNSEADRIQALLLQSLAKEKVVQQALGPNAELLLTSPIKKGNKASRKEDTMDDMFKLPEMPSSSKCNKNHREDETSDESFNENFLGSEECATTSAGDSSLDESNPRHCYNLNIQAIDVKSKEFLQLPADVRHEILVDIKETRKQSSWGRLHELPSQSDDFSNFQMKRLLKRRDVQVSLETAEQEMGGRTLTYAELTNIFSEEGILETEIVEKGTKQISSDEHTRFLLVKDLKKKLANVKEEPIKEEKLEIMEKQNLATTSTTTNDNKGDQLGSEYDADLELAIALSLEDDSNRVYDEKDYDYDSDESLKLTKAQRQQLQNAAKGPARSYMIEYAGMNNEEITGILEKTQTNAEMDDTLDIEKLIGPKDLEEREPIDTSIEKTTKTESQGIHLCVTDDSYATELNLEEIKEDKNKSANDSKPNKTFNKIAKTKIKDIGETVLELKDVTKTEVSNEILSDSEEIKDSDATDTDLEEVEDIEDPKYKLNNKAPFLEEECVIEETPPCLADEDIVKLNPTKAINIQIDLTKPLNPEEDLFADVFENMPTKEESLENIETVVKDTKKVEKSLVSKETKAFTIEDSKESKELKSELLNKENTKVEIKTPPNTENILLILDELKQQADEVKKIKLENVKISDSIIEISDEETVLKSYKDKNETIEICDSDDCEKRPSTPPLEIQNFINQSPKFNAKSPNFRTPSKNHAITEFFNIDYVVKHTPDKSLEEQNEAAMKVKSPYFVRKTPKSGRKSAPNSPSPNRKSSKANKILFERDNATSLNENDDKLEADFIPIKETKPTNSEEILNEVANILKSQKTTEELNTLATDLAKKRQELENERNRQDRMGMSITQRMNSDCQDLLRLFGIPFIVAPMEAEAQCAFLDIIQLTNGTITDDSDIWLFGGRTVYKNFFAQTKHVMEFRAEKIEKEFNCDRKKLIQLACLVGSDYTTGIHGIGAVTALEILASFTAKESANKPDNSTTTSIQNVLATLERFRNWWQSFKSAVTPPGSSARLALQKKLKNIELHEGFPSTAVVEAYLTPKVDQNKEAFTWGYPDVESLKEFARKSFGWTANKTDEILTPVLKKLNEKRTQQSIRNYFNVKNSLSLRQIRVSKRVQSAIEKLSGNIDSDDTAEKPTKAKRSRKTNTATGRKEKKNSAETLEGKRKEVNEVSVTIQDSCINSAAMGPVKRATKRVKIPEIKEVIPQREKDLAQMEANKKLAAEILKNTSKETKKKRKT